jgi:hypothetical protein
VTLNTINGVLLSSISIAGGRRTTHTACFALIKGLESITLIWCPMGVGAILTNPRYEIFSLTTWLTRWNPPPLFQTQNKIKQTKRIWFCHKRHCPKIKKIKLFFKINNSLHLRLEIVRTCNELDQTLSIKLWHALLGFYYHSKAVSTMALSHEQRQQTIFTTYQATISLSLLANFTIKAEF